MRPKRLPCSAWKIQPPVCGASRASPRPQPLGTPWCTHRAQALLVYTRRRKCGRRLQSLHHAAMIVCARAPRGQRERRPSKPCCEERGAVRLYTEFLGAFCIARSHVITVASGHQQMGNRPSSQHRLLISTNLSRSLPSSQRCLLAWKVWPPSIILTITQHRSQHPAAMAGVMASLTNGFMGTRMALSIAPPLRPAVAAPRQVTRMADSSSTPCSALVQSRPMFTEIQ